MKSVDWYKKVLKDKKDEIIVSVILAFVVLILTAIWYWWIGKGFEWQKIELISQPSLLFRLFYSALVYGTLGAFLYKIKFYKVLYWLLVVYLQDMKFYKETKNYIWGSLILVMYFFIVPVAVNILNAILSIIYNLLVYCLYIFPLLFILFILILMFIKVKNQCKK